MNVFRAIEQDATMVGWGVRVMLLGQPGTEGAEAIESRIAGFGGIVEERNGSFYGT